MEEASQLLLGRPAQLDATVDAYPSYRFGGSSELRNHVCDTIGWFGLCCLHAC
jgi:hypothetical protein